MYPTFRYHALANLSAEDETALVTLGDREVSWKAGETIQREGDAVRGFYLHVGGWIHSSIVMRSGARLIQKVHLPGDMLGTPSMALDQAADTLTTITSAVTSFVPFERLRELYYRRPRLAMLFTFAVQMERLSLMDMLAVTGRASAREQLARVLLDLYTRLTPLGVVSNNAFELPLTQEVIGDLTGITAVHVNRTLRVLREEGLIEQKGHFLRILDLPQLQAIAPIRPRTPRFEPDWLPSS
ncbi:Crp/Fnr family transcriptional regulator [Sphingomonas sp. BK235]|uniref:Crp/Fnr family transcriptional regulator n=1 Tax=Sphingomonas sp. BK235 TaxID=2512131 RepID=UPI00105110DE|nr:Crp/Fnr family transcriptional regulator [Sphingomonas sp. BK235]TCP31350.1 Crp/Fnr family transcriptional regulator [Sphingomonas sp. BK235]